jgi:hypothetical protein
MAYSDGCGDRGADRRAYGCRRTRCGRDRRRQPSRGGGVNRGEPERAAPSIWDTTPENQRALAPRVRGRPGAGRNWCQRASARRRPVRPTGAGGRRNVRWPTGPTARLARSRRPARQRGHGLRPAGAGRPRGIRLPLVYGRSLARQREQWRLFGDRRVRPVHLCQSGRAGGRCHPERVAAASRQRRRGRDRRAAPSRGSRAPTGPGVVAPPRRVSGGGTGSLVAFNGSYPPDADGWCSR